MHVWPICAFGTKCPNTLSKKEEEGKMGGQEGQINGGREGKQSRKGGRSKRTEERKKAFLQLYFGRP